MSTSSPDRHLRDWVVLAVLVAIAVAGLGAGIVRLACEPPTLSELFRQAVVSETVTGSEVSHASA